VKNAFLHGNLTETVYAQQPAEFLSSSHPDYVCKLNKSLYGLKQAPRTWFLRFTSFLLKVGFQAFKSDTSLFVLHRGCSCLYLLLYVDENILTSNSSEFLNHIIADLCSEFAMTDLSPLQHFLGISVQHHKGGLILSQQQYASDLLDRAQMTNYNPCLTPVDTHSKPSTSDVKPLANPTKYRSQAGGLQYLTLARPDICFAVQQACLFMHAPTDIHMNLAKHILHYIKGTINHGLHISRSRPHDLVIYSDDDWAGCPDTRRSTFGLCAYLGDNLVSWSSKRQPTVSQSSADAEYRGIANVVAKSSWLCQLLTELGHPPQHAKIVFYDNVSASYMSTQPVEHQRTKHIEIDLHFVRDKVSPGEIKVLHVPSSKHIEIDLHFVRDKVSLDEIKVLHVPSSSQYVDIFTKGLLMTLFLRVQIQPELVPLSTLRGVLAHVFVL
jgi:hypothetical protein